MHWPITVNEIIQWLWPFDCFNVLVKTVITVMITIILFGHSFWLHHTPVSVPELVHSGAGSFRSGAGPFCSGAGSFVAGSWQKPIPPCLLNFMLCYFPRVSSWNLGMSDIIKKLSRMRLLLHFHLLCLSMKFKTWRYLSWFTAVVCLNVFGVTKTASCMSFQHL